MADPVATTKLCSNCKRDIAESNFVMHEIHCRKNIILCPKCSEPVPRVNLDEHLDEYHALVDCDLCSKSIERSRLEEHKETLCSKRRKTCEYCELPVPADELDSHVSYCGTRTEICPKCMQYVMHKDQTMHEVSECALPERMPEQKWDSAGEFDSHRDFPEEFDDFPYLPFETAEEFHRNSNRRVLDYADYYPDVEDILPPFKSFPLNQADGARRNAQRTGLNVQQSEDDGLFKDFVKFATEKSNAIKESNASKSDDRDWEQDVPFLPCEFCEESFPSDVIIQHQAMCSGFEDFDSDDQNERYGANLLREEKEKYKEKPDSMNRLIHPASLERETTMLPCQFCSDLYPNEQLMIHQLDCEARRMFNHNEAEEEPHAVGNRHPSLPSGLDAISANSDRSCSPLKSSTSIPLRLSQLQRTDKQSASSNKPRPGVPNETQPRTFTGATAPVAKRVAPRKPMARQFPSREEQTTSNDGFENQRTVRQSKGPNVRPPGVLPVEGRVTNSWREGQPTRNNVAVNPIRHNAAMTRMSNTSGGTVNRPHGATGASPSFSVVNASRSSYASRRTGTDQIPTQHSQGRGRQYGQTGTRRTDSTATTEQNYQGKGSRQVHDRQRDM